MKALFCNCFGIYVLTWLAQLQVCPSKSKTRPVGHLTAARLWPPLKSLATHRTASRQFDSVLKRKYSLPGRFLHSSSITAWSLSDSALSEDPKSICPLHRAKMATVSIHIWGKIRMSPEMWKMVNLNMAGRDPLMMMGYDLRFSYKIKSLNVKGQI